MKAVTQTRHLPYQGTLVSSSLGKQSCIFYTTRGQQTRAPQAGNRNPHIFLSDYKVSVAHTQLASMVGHLV